MSEIKPALITEEGNIKFIQKNKELKRKDAREEVARQMNRLLKGLTTESNVGFWVGSSLEDEIINKIDACYMPDKELFKFILDKLFEEQKKNLLEFIEKIESRDYDPPEVEDVNVYMKVVFNIKKKED